MFDSGTSITRDELTFAKFIRELQHKFDEVSQIAKTMKALAA